MNKKKRISELLKIYSANLDLLTPEECARLHQYGSDQEKLSSNVKKVMYDVLIRVHKGKFPKTINKRIATIRDAGTRAPSKITWETLQKIAPGVTEDMYMHCSTLQLGELKKHYPEAHKKLSQTKWFQENTTETSGYITWSDPDK